MIRTQIQLNEEQSKALKHLSSQRHISMAELIRQGIDQYIYSCGMVSSEERRQRALNMAGQFHSGKKDLSERHDDYLAEDYNQ